MGKSYKTKEPPTSELAGLRQRVAELEAIAAEQKRLEGVLKASQEVLRIMFESITDGIPVTDLNGVITDTNQRTSDHHNRLPPTEVRDGEDLQDKRAAYK